MAEQDIEAALIEKLRDLKYTYRDDIQDRATLERNFRKKFDELNRVNLTDGEFDRLLEKIVTPDVFAAAQTLRNINSFERDDGTPLHYRYAPDLETSAAGRKNTSLFALLKHSIDCGHIKEEGFSDWHHKVLMRSQNRTDMERLRGLVASGRSEISFDDAVTEITDEDRNIDFLPVLLKALPALRNQYAHGSTSLHNRAINTIRIVSEIINQLYKN